MNHLQLGIKENTSWFSTPIIPFLFINFVVTEENISVMTTLLHKLLQTYQPTTHPVMNFSTDNAKMHCNQKLSPIEDKTNTT